MRRLIALLLCILMTTSCVYSRIKLPLDTDVDNTQLGAKVGMASDYSLLWLVAWGDASTQAASKNGEISTIRHLDSEQLFVLFGLYTRFTTIAYGD